MARLERAASTSQMWRPTNWATPGYSISIIIPRRGRKSKIFLSVVIPVVKAAFMPFSTTGGNPANAGATRLSVVLPCSVPDTATAHPNHVRYQLRYTRIFIFLPLYHGGEENQRFFCLWSFMWSKLLLCRFRQPEENPLSPVPQGIPGFCPSRAWIGSTHSQTVCGNFAYYTSFLRVLQEGETLRMGEICRTTIHIEQEYNTRHGLQAIQ